MDVSGMGPLAKGHTVKDLVVVGEVYAVDAMGVHAIPLRWSSRLRR